MADECPSSNYDGSGSVTRGLGRVRNVQGSTPTYTWGPAMMLQVEYMAHMCLQKRILGRVRVKVNI